MAKKTAKGAVKVQGSDQPKISGSAAIRDILAAGITKPADIIEAVKTQYGLEVKPALVNNVKSKAKAGSPKKPRGGGKRSAPTTEVAKVLHATVDFIKMMGGFAAAKAAIEELETAKSLLD